VTREQGVCAVRDRERKPKHRRRSGLGFRVVSVRQEELEVRASDTHAIKPRSIQLLAIWASFYYEMDCKLMKSKPHILTYTKVYFIFWGPFNFRGPVRSHSLHGPKDFPAWIECFLW